MPGLRRFRTAGGSAEGLLLLDQNEEFFRIVVTFDGVPNGRPIEYFLPR